LPNLFFSEVLPSLNDLASLKLALHIFWRLHQKKGFPRYLRRRELEADTVLRRSLAPNDEDFGSALDAAVRSTERQGIILRLSVEIGSQTDELYVLNDARGREVEKKLRQGELDLGQPTAVVGPIPGNRQERANIFELYEQNLGLVTPLLAEELAEAQRLYPADWIEDAFRQAVIYNHRHWRYVRRILERWAVEGKR